MTTAIIEQEIEIKKTPKTVWDLKKVLKELANEIKEFRVQVKETQRKNSGDCAGKQCRLLNIRSDYRHKHIAYCLLRGTEYDRIEKSISSGNQPNWSIIEGVKNVYGSY